MTFVVPRRSRRRDVNRPFGSREVEAWRPLLLGARYIRLRIKIERLPNRPEENKGQRRRVEPVNHLDALSATLYQDLPCDKLPRQFTVSRSSRKSTPLVCSACTCKRLRRRASVRMGTPIRWKVSGCRENM